MEKNKILSERKALMRLAGKGEYAFFPSILVSAAALILVLTLAAVAFMNLPEIKASYTAMYGRAIESAISNVEKLPSAPLESIAEQLVFRLEALFVYLPAVLVLFFGTLLIICPIYQGTVRWSAFLIEERSSLPIGAILFYFTAPSLYFKALFLSIRLFLRRFGAALMFFLPPLICLEVGRAIAKNGEAGGEVLLTLVLSIVWLTLAAVFYFIFCRRYAAVRYLFALGETKKIFKRSVHLTKDRLVWLTTLRLRLFLNMPLAFTVIGAPFALSRIISAQGLTVRALIDQKRACEGQ